MASEPPITTDTGGMVSRIKALLLTPKDEWAKIAAEPMTVVGIMTKWVVPLSAIGPLAGLVAMLSTGVTINGIPLLTAPPQFLIANFLLNWVSAILCTYVLALVIDALAPSFGGQKDPVAALKVAAFGSTAGFLSGIFQIHPWLMILGLVGFYTYYLIYLGLPTLMKSSGDKTIVYFLATFVISVVLIGIAGYVTRMISYSMLPEVIYNFNALR